MAPSLSSTPADPGHGLPSRIVQLSRRPQGIRLYFPPLRSMAASLGLALFGALCAALPTLGSAALISAIGLDAHRLLVIVLLAGFALPFFAFGLAFVVMAAYQVANSLEVLVAPAGITTERRILGFTLARRALASSEIAAIVPEIPSRFQTPLATEPSYRLVAKRRASDAAGVVVAESLSGEALMRRVRSVIEDAAAVSRQSPQCDEPGPSPSTH